jgi:GTP-binding protein HflX
VLLAGFDAAVTRDNIALALTLDGSDGAALAFAYRHAQVVERRERDGKLRLTLRISPQDRARFEQIFPKKVKFLQGIEANS